MPPVSRSHGGHHTLAYYTLPGALATSGYSVTSYGPPSRTKAESGNRTLDERLETFSFTSKLIPQVGCQFMSVLWRYVLRPPGVRLTMTIRTQPPDIIKCIVLRIAVDVV